MRCICSTSRSSRWCTHSVRFAEPRPGQILDAESLVARAQAAEAGEAIRFVAPQPGSSAEVGIRTAGGHGIGLPAIRSPDSVLGRLRDDLKLMEVVKRIHSLEIAGPVGNHWIEVVAGWAIVLVVSGIFLWWPRGRSGGIYSVRGQRPQRIWWRDVHAVTGVIAAVGDPLPCRHRNAVVGILGKARRAPHRRMGHRPAAIPLRTGATVVAAAGELGSRALDADAGAQCPAVGSPHRQTSLQEASSGANRRMANRRRRSG